MADIVFAARLNEADWDDGLRGWRCPALAVPGAIIEALYIEGARVDSARYEVLKDHALIRWIPPERPQRATASVKLTEALSLGAETDRWKKLAIVLPVAATILSAGITATATLAPKFWPAPNPPSSAQPMALPGRSPKPMDDPHPPPRPAGEVSNVSQIKALLVVTGETVQGKTDEHRWFRFAVTDKDSTKIKITLRNLYNTNSFQAAVYNSARDKIVWDFCGQNGCTLRFTSPQPDTYFLEVYPNFGNVVAYDLMISSQ